ncbi:MAG TPA: LysR family transcriptional regulator [Gemmatimonadaceae bacterium]|jgi:DNA-binding transcriptional LysR family regulator|nr:LysR family transcriptional regulator [Gemmatimonadaceae bacterium]
MDLKDLRYAIAVADEGSFTRAAARLRLAQQALSKQIGDLERELEVRLFDRMPRGTRLTPAGAAFVEAARSTLAQSQRAMAYARTTNRRESQLLRVGLTPGSVLAGSAAAAFSFFRRRHPMVRIDVLESAPMALIDAIRDGTIDLAILCSPPDDSGEMAGECIAERPLGAVLPATHPLAEGDVVRLRDLVDLPLITFGREADPGGYDALVQALARRGLKPRLADVRASGPPSLIGPIVAEGDAWALATADCSWPVYERIPGLAFRHFADAPILEQRWILWLYDTASPLVAQFTAMWTERSADLSVLT